MIRAALPLLATAVLTACGGGGGGSDGAAPCVVQHERLYLFGDSTTADPIVSTTLQADLDAHFGAGIVTVTSKAVGRTSLVQLHDGTDGLNAPWPAPLAGATRAIIAHGINDARRLERPEDVAALYRVMLAASPVPTMVQTPVQSQVSWLSTPEQTALVAATAQAMRSLPAPMIDVNAAKPVPMVDGVHPTADGYRQLVHSIIAPRVIDAIAAQAGCAS